MPNNLIAEPFSLSSLIGDLEAIKYNPSLMSQKIYEYLERTYNGEIDIVDPSNPFTFLLEAATACTSMAVKENILLLKDQYPVLATTHEQLYKHMSDVDYAERFATPSTATFIFMFHYEQLLNNFVPTIDPNYKKLTIPRNTKIMLNTIPFSLQYPIDIKYYLSGLIRVEHDAHIKSPIETLRTNILEHVVRSDSVKNKWLIFSTTCKQFSISSTQHPIQSSITFYKKIPFDDLYYFCRVFYKIDEDSNWMDLNTTHTDQVYNIRKPTAVLKVLDSELVVYIPQIYTSNNLVDGIVRIDIYTTKGFMDLNSSDITVSSFKTSFEAIDEINDISPHTNNIVNVSSIIYSKDRIYGGTNGKSFKDIKENVITNSLNVRDLPITNVDIIENGKLQNFNIIKNVDIITNRMFLAFRSLPKPNNQIFYSPMNVMMGSIIVNIDSIRDLPNVNNNISAITIRSNSIYKLENHQLTLLTSTEVDDLKELTNTSLIEIINNDSYFYCPFHYVLDFSENTFELRPYYLDKPVADGLNFQYHNESSRLVVNTSSYSIIKTDNGYDFVIITKSDSLYQDMDDRFLNVQLAYIPVGETTYSYLNGVQAEQKFSKERLFTFHINTDNNIIKNDILVIDNFSFDSDENLETFANLVSQFKILYSTSSVPMGYSKTEKDKLVGNFLLNRDSILISEESVQITFGYSLKQLWASSRLVSTQTEYEKYTQNVPMLYSKTVFRTDPITNAKFSVDVDEDEIIWVIEHRAGDPVLDHLNRPVYKHRIGDPVLDSNGNLKPIGLNRSKHIIDLCLMESELYFATNPLVVEYRESSIQTLVNWITEDLVEENKKLLEQTKLFYYPKQAANSVSVITGSGDGINIPASQGLKIDLYVSNSVHKDLDSRILIERKTTEIVNQWMDSQTISISQLTSMLHSAYGDSVSSLDISGLGGDLNLNTLTIVKPEDKIILRKHLMVQEDDKLIVKDAINLRFIELG